MELVRQYQRKPRLGVSLTVLAVSIIVMSGCAEKLNNDTHEWSDPAWFAEAIAARESIQLDAQQCIYAKGWDINVDPLLGIDALNVPIEGELDALDCIDQAIADQTTWSPADPEYRAGVYARELDLKRCFENLGAVVSEPPPFEVWEEEFIRAYVSQDVDSGFPWAAWSEIIDSSQMPELTYEELEELCPQWLY